MDIQQLKIKNIEKNLVELLDNLHGISSVTSRAVLDFNETRRKKFKDGYYLVTIQESGNESHGVMIEKRTNNEDTSFHLFDPNGKQWANKSGYYLEVSHNKQIKKLKIDISPKKSWNKMGLCGLWTTVMVIFLTNVKQSKTDDKLFPKTSVKKFYASMSKDKQFKKFINEINDQLIVGRRIQYNSKSQVKKYISEIIEKIKPYIDIN
jgi:hypothetical protein